jgi:hypothetical protein
MTVVQRINGHLVNLLLYAVLAACLYLFWSLI